MTSNHHLIISVALNELVASRQNVRRTGRREGIEALAASILAHGLRQNLNVRLAPSGRYEVVAGERRHAALKLLAKRKLLAKNEPVLCRVLAEGDDPEEISLAENLMREPMHPDDQCRAFLALAEDKGMVIEDIAARFGVTPAIVRQRLKLARVSPRLRARFRKGEMTLAHMEALAISDDHAAQEQAWDNLPDWDRSPHLLKDALTNEALPLTDKLAVLVGVAAYEAAGGAIIRDLFDAEDEGYLADRALVERLAAAIMADEVTALQAEGWKWVIPETEPDYSTRYSRVYPQAEGDSLSYTAEDKARAGARVRLEQNGTLRIERGLVHPDDTKRQASAQAGDTPDGAGTYLTGALVEDVTAHRTAALAVELSCNPAVALAATVHALALPLLYGRASGSCLKMGVIPHSLTRYVKSPAECPAHAALVAEGERWDALLPDDHAALFDWCLDQPQETLLSLLAHVAALSVDAVKLKVDRVQGVSLAHADQLARALSLDMGTHWTPTAEGFGQRLTRAQLVDAAREAGVLGECGNLAGAKKDEAARRVTKALARAGWLPAPLRAPQQAEPEAEAQAA